MAKLVSKTYGGALFSLAMEEKNLDGMQEEVLAMREVFKENEDLVRVFNHPKVSKDEKVKLMENIFKGRISDELLGFLVLIVEKDRYQELDAVLDYFIGEVREYQRIGLAYVTSAAPLREEQKKRVEERLLQTTKYVKFNMVYQEDQSLIGGLIIRIGDRVIDSSIRTQLGTLARELSDIQLAEQN